MRPASVVIISVSNAVEVSSATCEQSVGLSCSNLTVNARACTCVHWPAFMKLLAGVEKPWLNAEVSVGVPTHA